MKVRLTDREQEIIQLLVRGRSQKQIASSLGISRGNVARRIHLLARKLPTSSGGPTRQVLDWLRSFDATNLALK